MSRRARLFVRKRVVRRVKKKTGARQKTTTATARPGGPIAPSQTPSVPSRVCAFKRVIFLSPVRRSRANLHIPFSAAAANLYSP